MVPVIARQLSRELGLSSPHRDDLESAGREGLVNAARRFEPDRGVPFRRYANHRVRGAMLDALRRESTLPRRAHERLRALSGALELNEAASEELGAEPSPGAATADARLAEHLANLATALATGLVAQTVNDDEQQPIALDPRPSPEEAVARSELRQLLLGALDGLTEQERRLVHEHYFEGRRFDHVAAELGMSKSWASRLHARAIGKLSARLGGGGSGLCADGAGGG